MQYFGYACFIYEQFGFHQYIFKEPYWKIERCALLRDEDNRALYLLTSNTPWEDSLSL